MQFKLYADVHEFYNDTYDVLMLHEAQNMIPLGNIIIGHIGKDQKIGYVPICDSLMLKYK